MRQVDHVSSTLDIESKTSPNRQSALPLIRNRHATANFLYLSLRVIVIILAMVIGGGFLFNSRPTAAPKDTQLIPFRKGNKWGFSDSDKKLTIAAKYDYVDRFREGVARVALYDKYGFIDESGKEILPLKYDYVDFFVGDLAAVQLKGKFGFVDKAGKEAIPLKYDYADFFVDGLAKVRLKDKEFYIGRDGKEYYAP